MDALYVVKEGKKLRCGYTTGSCAAGAAKAAAIMLHAGTAPELVEIDTPAGVILRLYVECPQWHDDGTASCCIVKDAGDDPDVTNGMKIFAKVSKRQDGEIVIDGGEGVGRITREGFWGKVGEAAINPVPRRMIRDEVSKIAVHGWNVVIHVPGGKDIAKKTFNRFIGIEDGISIIGTTGIVEPMSDEAIKKTIYLELDKLYDDGSREILLVLGNYGRQVAEQLQLHAPRVKISNFIGDALLYCYHKGFHNVTLLGHIGKLSKLSIGVFNTHSHVCDGRIEAFIYYLALAGAPTSLIQEVQHCITSEEAVEILWREQYEHIFTAMRHGCIKRVRRYVKDKNFHINILIYSMKYDIVNIPS